MLCNLDFLIITTVFLFVIGMVSVIYVNRISLDCPPNDFFVFKKKNLSWCLQSLICKHCM
jgi:hypothetical protein